MRRMSIKVVQSTVSTRLVLPHYLEWNILMRLEATLMYITTMRRCLILLVLIDFNLLDVLQNHYLFIK